MIFQQSIIRGAQPGIIESSIFVIIITGMIITAAHKIFSLITKLPDRVPRWIGQQIQPFGEEKQEKQVSGIAVGGMKKASGGMAEGAKGAKRMASGNAGGGSEGDGGAEQLGDSSFKSGQS